MARVSTQGDVFAAIADPTRRQLLERMRERERSVAELSESTGISVANASLHLQVLHRAGLVSRRVARRHRFYRLDPAPLRQVTDWAGELTAFWTGKLDDLAQLAEKFDAKTDRSDL